MNFDDKFDRSEALTVPPQTDLQLAIAPFLAGRKIECMQVLPGGFSNTNLKLTVSRSRAPIVVRLSSKPKEEVEAEIAVMDFLNKEIPVPAILHFEVENPILSKHIMILDFLEGTPLHQIEDSLSSSEVTEFSADLGTVLAKVHHHSFLTSGLLGPGPSIRMPFSSFGEGIVSHMLTRVKSEPFKKRFSVDEGKQIRRFIEENQNIIEPVKRASCLVHSDFNQKNILATRRNGHWLVSGILDWEFSFSGSPLIDFGNFFRFEHEMRQEYAPTLISAYRDAGGELPENWRKIAKYLDLINMVIFCSDTRERPKTIATAKQVIRNTLSDW